MLMDINSVVMCIRLPRSRDESPSSSEWACNGYYKYTVCDGTKGFNMKWLIRGVNDDRSPFLRFMHYLLHWPELLVMSRSPSRILRQCT
jgi:hypothetical protein